MLANDFQDDNDTREIYFCQDCGMPLDTDQQEHRYADPITIGTCRNRACTLWSVTLTVTEFPKLTEVQLNQYRKSVANIKATLAKLGG